MCWLCKGPCTYLLSHLPARVSLLPVPLTTSAPEPDYPGPLTPYPDPLP